MLKKTGDTMTGTLNQRTPAGVTPAYILTSPDIDLSQSSTAYQSGGLIIFRDKNNKDGNYINSYVDQYGANVLTLQASIGVDDNRKTTGVGIWIKQNGESGSWAFPCNINNSILTTVSHGSNYVKLGNGLILQWGIIVTNQDTSGANYATIALSTPFSDTKYRIFTNVTAMESDFVGGVARNTVTALKTTTSFKISYNISAAIEWFAIGW